MNLIKTFNLLKMDMMALGLRAKRLPVAYREVAEEAIDKVGKELHEIDSLVLAGRDAEAFIRIADHVYPQMKDTYFKPNYDYNEGWSTLLDEFREGKVKDVADAVKRRRDKKKETSASAYCGKKDTEEYWKELEEGEEGSEAVDEFIEYIKNIKC